mmetsp:Transcript_16696/g.47507  ORF Transcript_16696/g.47507 Transcript_16696/m.47507 type:complete len:285 (-) Transcript_16696:402-1256(-)
MNVPSSTATEAPCRAAVARARPSRTSPFAPPATFSHAPSECIAKRSAAAWNEGTQPRPTSCSSCFSTARSFRYRPGPGPSTGAARPSRPHGCHHRSASGEMQRSCVDASSLCHISRSPPAPRAHAHHSHTTLHSAGSDARANGESSRTRWGSDCFQKHCSNTAASSAVAAAGSAPIRRSDCDAIESISGSFGNGRWAIDHAMFEHSWPANSAIRAMDSAASASSRGRCLNSSFANDHDGFAMFIASHDRMLGSAADAIAFRRGTSSKRRVEAAHARPARFCGCN